METKQKWQITEPVRLAPALIAAAGDPVVAEILYRRGYRTAAQITAFLRHDAYTPWDFAGHPLVVPLIERIERALADKEKITVYGDYDVDGITSTALWVDTLRCLGAEAAYYIPDRFKEGYGVNTDALRKLADAGTKLVITCDCGITNYQEIAEAKVRGLDVLVTDHHELPARLPAVPVFNPKMLDPEHPAYMLPGVGASFIVAKELLRRAGQEDYAENLLALLALGIIADVVPLTKDNRWYLQEGIPRMLASPRPGIKALLEVARIHPVHSTEEDIAFQVIPRLNAAGRLGSAGLAVDLLLAADLPAAQSQARELNSLNETRKVLCDRVLEEAGRQMGACAEEMPAIALYQENWHEGVIGIVAGRLAEQYQKPALLMTRKENGHITGSARTGGNINILQALFLCEDLLTKFGGHEGAAGFSLPVENLALFMRKINAVVKDIPVDAGDEQGKPVDAILSPALVNIDLYNRIRELAPFGAGNPAPIFLIDGRLVTNQLMKTGSAHRRLRFAKDGQTADAVWWNSAPAAVADDEQFLARLRLNLFRDNVNVQLDIIDVMSCAKTVFSPPVPAGQFIDMRGRSSAELTVMYPEALFFGEGVDSHAAASRMELRATDTLVMLTVPCQAAIWTEILQKAAPQRVVVAWDTQVKAREQVVDDLWRHLMGMVKFSLRAYGGVMTPQRAAVRLGWTREIVTAGLQALADVGLIGLTVLDEDRISLSLRQNARPGLRKLQSYRCFIKILAEVEAYRNHVRNLPVERIQEMLYDKGRKGEVCKHRITSV